MNTFTAKLTQLFESVEVEFRARQVEKYLFLANSQLESLLKWLDGPEPDARAVREWRMPDFVDVVSGTWSRNWAMLQDKRRRGEFRAAHDRATKEANHVVDQAKLHFITKQSKKLANATKHHTDSPKIGGKLSCDDGIVVGGLTATYKNGDEFFLSMSIIRNCRYGRGYTSFFQFPSRFSCVKLRGEPVKARFSEAWLEENFK